MSIIDLDSSKHMISITRGLILPYYELIQELYPYKWVYGCVGSGGEDGRYDNSKHIHSQICVSSKGSIIHIYATVYSGGMYNYAIPYGAHGIIDKTIKKETMIYYINNKDNRNVFLSAEDKGFFDTNYELTAENEELNFLKFAPFGKINEEYFKTIFKTIQKIYKFYRIDKLYDELEDCYYSELSKQNEIIKEKNSIIYTYEKYIEELEKNNDKKLDNIISNIDEVIDKATTLFEEL
jgi:hypothetical protein